MKNTKHLTLVTEQARYPVKDIKTMVDSGKYRIDTNDSSKIWSNAKKSMLIESFIINISPPPICIQEYEYSKYYVVIDGVQRLMAIRDFYSDLFALSGLQFRSELNGKKYSQLTNRGQRSIDRRYLSCVVILNETPGADMSMLIESIYNRLNA